MGLGFFNPDDEPPTTVNPFICLLTIDSTWKFKIIPPPSAPTAFGQGGSSQREAAALGDQPKWKMELKLKRKYKCKCISVLAGFEDVYNENDYELDPSDVEAKCDKDGFRTMRDHTVKVVGVCDDPQNPNYVSPVGLSKKPCKCNLEIDCEYISKDLEETMPGILTGPVESENNEDDTLRDLGTECGCTVSRAWGVHPTEQDTILLLNSCFDCVMGKIGCDAEGPEAQARIASIMTQLLMTEQYGDTIADLICNVLPDLCPDKDDWPCPRLNGFEVVK